MPGLDEVLLSEAIRLIRGHRWSGVLAVTQGEVTKGLYFLAGNLAFAASTLEEDRLGANLLRIGRISHVQFRAAVREAQEPGRRLGQALVEAGVLRPEELAAAVTGQIERIVFSLFRWTSGALRHRALDQPIPGDLALDLSTPRLLLLGARIYPDEGRLEAALGPRERRLRRAALSPFDLERLPVSAAERAVLALATREARVADLLALPFPRPALVRAAYGLLAAEALEEVDAPAARVAVPPVTPAPLPEMRTAPPVPAGAPSEAVEAPPPAFPADRASEVTARPVPRGPDVALADARALLERGLRDRAVEILRDVLDRAPAAHECRRLLAMTLAGEGAFDPEVEHHFLAVLEARPRDTELRYHLASYYRRAGLAARALLQLRLVLASDPGHAAAWRDLGELEAGEGGR